MERNRRIKALEDSRPVYLTSEESAAYLRISPITLSKMRMSGEGPRYRKHGRRVVYTVDDLKTWSDEHGQASTNDNAVDHSLVSER
ncbi:helix-turn-helix domain-containing protein [Emcibacter nanhaiensis]|uniref:Helix-turn-helix domain-containing protein n=1 Tax=Emcibacter nanhaiensis TaxID=1505037 RepID=A0A501PHJ8_9PROT|nr:helix-turn-helix domain-containing protein [Emcibacter nanhaiensis]TPD59316.1 helix-turn-helix domain-containing protein [Emcibacter nanhaiensis]